MISHDRPRLSLCVVCPGQCKKNLSLPSLNFKPRDVLLLSSRTFYRISWNCPSILFLPLLLRHSGVLEPTPTWTNNCPQPQVLSQCIGCVFGGSQGTLRNPTQTHGDLKTESLPARDLPGDPNHDLLALRCYSANHCTTTASSHSNHHHVGGHNRNCSTQSSA